MQMGMPARPSAPAATAACAILLATASGHAADPAAPNALGPGRIEAAIAAEMNRVRAERGRAPLTVSPALRRPARAHSRWLLATGRLTHDGPDGSPFWTRLVAAGFPRDRRMAENLARLGGCDAGTARRVVAMWMASPGHRANLLNPRYRWVGVGSASDAGCDVTVLTTDYGS